MNIKKQIKKVGQKIKSQFTRNYVIGLYPKSKGGRIKVRYIIKKHLREHNKQRTKNLILAQRYYKWEAKRIMKKSNHASKLQLIKVA